MPYKLIMGAGWSAPPKNQKRKITSFDLPMQARIKKKSTTLFHIFFSFFFGSHFPLSVLPLYFLTYPSQISFKSMASFFTNGYFMNICIYMQICVSNFNLINSYYVNFMYIFRIDFLALDNELVCSFLGKTTSLAPSIFLLSIVYCTVLSPGGLFLYLIWYVHQCHSCLVHICAFMLVRLHEHSF